ncbi:MAG: hypothetical protein JJU33_10010 [Phycisphaerales bacterium]|nr:hypothetical protein [Phycisphaerales bacterium]
MIVTVMLLAGAGVCMASTPLFEPDDTPRGETVLEQIRYRVPSIGENTTLRVSAFPLDRVRVLLSVHMIPLRTTAPGSSLPLVIADLDNNSKSFRERLHPGFLSFSIGGHTGTIVTSARSQRGWPTRLWMIDLQTWRAAELIETDVMQEDKRSLLDAAVSPCGRRILASMILRTDAPFELEWEVYDIPSGGFTLIDGGRSLRDALIFAPDGESIYRSYRTQTAEEKGGFGLTVVDRLGLDGSELGEVVPSIAVPFTLRLLSPTESHATIRAEPGDGAQRDRVAILDLSTGKVTELDDERARAGGYAKWNASGDRLLLRNRGDTVFHPEPSHIFEIGLDGQTLRHWEFGDHQITDVFWMPGRDDPYAVTARGEIYLLHGEGDNTFRRRVWSIHRSPLRNP